TPAAPPRISRNQTACRNALRPPYLADGLSAVVKYLPIRRPSAVPTHSLRPGHQERTVRRACQSRIFLILAIARDHRILYGRAVLFYPSEMDLLFCLPCRQDARRSLRKGLAAHHASPHIPRRNVLSLESSAV